MRRLRGIVLLVSHRGYAPDPLNLLKNDSLCKTSSCEGSKQPYHIQAQETEDGWIVTIPVFTLGILMNRWKSTQTSLEAIIWLLDVGQTSTERKSNRTLLWVWSLTRI